MSPYFGEYAVLPLRGSEDVCRNPTNARLMQLFRRPIGGSARHAILRSVLGPKRPACDPILDSREAQTARTADDQSAREGHGHGSYDPRAQHPAAGAGWSDQDRSDGVRPARQGTPLDKGGREAPASGRQGMGPGPTAI